MQLIIDKYLNKNNQNLVHYLSHQAVMCIAHDHFSCDRILKALGLILGHEGPGLGLGLKIFTARRVCIARTMQWQDVCPSVSPSVGMSVRLSFTRWYYV